MVRSSPDLTFLSHFMASAFLGSLNKRAMSRSCSLGSRTDGDRLDCLGGVGLFISCSLFTTRDNVFREPGLICHSIWFVRVLPHEVIGFPDKSTTFSRDCASRKKDQTARPIQLFPRVESSRRSSNGPPEEKSHGKDKSYS